MDKETALQKMQSEGFDVELVGMVLMLNVPQDCEDKDLLVNSFKARLAELGYDCSFGWRGKGSK